MWQRLVILGNKMRTEIYLVVSFNSDQNGTSLCTKNESMRLRYVFGPAKESSSPEGLILKLKDSITNIARRSVVLDQLNRFQKGLEKLKKLYIALRKTGLLQTKLTHFVG